MLGSPASQGEQCSAAEGIAKAKKGIAITCPSIALALARLARGGGGASSCPAATAAAADAANALLKSFSSRSGGTKTMEELSSLLLAAKEVAASGAQVDASALQAAADALASFKASKSNSKKTKKLFSARLGPEEGPASSVASVQAVVAASAASEAGASVPSSLTSGVVRALLEAGEEAGGLGLPILDADVDGGAGAMLAAARALSLSPSPSLARLVLGASKGAALATPEGAEAAALAVRALERLSPAPLVLQRQRKVDGGDDNGNEGVAAASLLLTDLRGDASAASGASVSASLSRDGKGVASAIPLTSRGDGVWTLDSSKALLSKTGGEGGVFDATFSISSESEDGAGSASLTSRVALPGAGVELKGGSAKISVVGAGGGGKASKAEAAAKTVSFPDQAAESFSLLASPNAKLKIEFELVDAATGNLLVEQPLQVAALVTGGSGSGGSGDDEAYLPASPAAAPSGSSTPPGAFVVALTAGAIAAQQASGTTAGGTYEVELVVAGAGGSGGGGSKNAPLRWKRLARVELPSVDHRGRSSASLAAALAAKKKEPNFISVQAADAGSAEDAAVGHALPEIVHAQRAPAVPASDAAAAVATVAVLLPLLVFLPLALKAAGLNLRGAPAPLGSSPTSSSLPALAFHSCVALLLCSYVAFWARMTVLEFLPKLLAVGLATVATGHGALRARAAARRSAPSKKDA